MQLTLKPEKPKGGSAAQVTLNGHASSGSQPTFGPEAFQDGYNTIRVTNAGTSPMTVERVELAVQFPRK